MNKGFWIDYAYIECGKLRQKIIKIMDKPKTPNKISKELQIHLSEASRVLIDFTKKSIAQCLNPESKLGRIYTLTKKGKELRKKFIE